MYRSPFYRSAPPLLQEVLLDARWAVLRAIRTSRPYHRYLSEVRATQWLTGDALQDLQRSRLDRLIRIAREGSPYYRELFEDLGIESAADFERIPFVTRSEARSRAAQLRNTRHRAWTVKGSTSGTSGSPLHLVKSLTEIRYETAHLQRQLEWAGYRPGDRLVWLRGDLIVDPGVRRPPFWRESRLADTLYMSSYHLSAGTVGAYLDALQAFRPAIIQAYPSSISLLANYLEAAGREYLGPLKGIVTSSETLSPDARAVIERRFGARVYDWYGSYERVAAIGTCEKGSYHLLSDYSLVELHPAEGGRMELVGTNLHNAAFPLIRYRTGDYVLVDPAQKCTCARHFPIIARILGREDDVVKTASGRRIGRLDHIFKGAHGVLEAKILQTELSRLEILVVASVEFSLSDQRLIEEKARTLTGNELEIRLDRVDHIERKARGKHQLVECRV
jgi:phenylacetate-coenzyme A ligase PaaK-like adenylate-forming protein